MDALTEIWPHVSGRGSSSAKAATKGTVHHRLVNVLDGADSNVGRCDGNKFILQRFRQRGFRNLSGCRPVQGCMLLSEMHEQP